MALNDRDKRALRFLIYGVLIVVAVAVLMEWFNHWALIRRDLTTARTELSAAASTGAKAKRLASVIPVLELPVEPNKQKILFRQKLSEQLKKAGLGAEPLQVLSGGSKRTIGGYRTIRVKCKAKGKLTQVFDFLAELKANPYLAGIEKLKFTCDQKDRQNVELTLTASTLAK